eukprot:UN14616
MLRTDFLDVSQKSSKRFQKTLKCIPVDSLNSEKYSTYLQKLFVTQLLQFVTQLFFKQSTF